MTKVFLRHFNKAGHCRRGVEILCAAYGINYDKLRTEGIEAEEVLETGHDYAARVVAIAEDEENGR